MTRTADADAIALVSSAAGGDEMAFARIVDAFHEDMRRVCVFVARDPSIADDAVQSAWSIAWRKLGSVRDPARVRLWLIRVAVNETKKLLRKRGRRVEMELLAWRMDERSRGVDPQTGIDSLDLRAALARLGPDDRALLAMRYLIGYNATELAEVLGITPSGTRNRLERLTTRLRRDLSDG
jgi:RNA polymerase sigma-70 factor (ECF subfamily)